MRQLRDTNNAGCCVRRTMIANEDFRQEFGSKAVATRYEPRR